MFLDLSSILNTGSKTSQCYPNITYFHNHVPDINRSKLDQQLKNYAIKRNPKETLQTMIPPVNVKRNKIKAL